MSFASSFRFDFLDFALSFGFFDFRVTAFFDFSISGYAFLDIVKNAFAGDVACRKGSVSE
jgi:hypothetical protein